MSDTLTNNTVRAAYEFIFESDEQDGMQTVEAKYTGERPDDEAFEFTPRFTRANYVDNTGHVAQMDSLDFLGGVVFALWQGKKITDDDASPQNFSTLTYYFGKITTERNERKRISDEINASESTFNAKGRLYPYDTVKRAIRAGTNG